MSYHIYTTEGIILKRQAFGEASIIVFVLTSDLGLIIASAKSARLSKSKLSSSLQEYQLVKISCIKGKNGWKVTNAVEDKTFFFEYPNYSKRVLAQISFFLLKMIQGESPHKDIFEVIKNSFYFMRDASEEDSKSLEMVIVLRILFLLGYVANSETTSPYLKDVFVWNQEILALAKNNNKTIIEIINKAIKESHL